VSDLFLFPSALRRDPAVEAWLNKRTDELGRLARFWFARLRDCGDDVRELMHDGCPTACAREAAFAHVGSYRAHVSVYFFFGALLPDPAGLLEGAGKRGRHVKVRPGRDLDAAALAGLIEAAYRDIKTR